MVLLCPQSQSPSLYTSLVYTICIHNLCTGRDSGTVPTSIPYVSLLVIRITSVTGSAVTQLRSGQRSCMSGSSNTCIFSRRNRV